MLRSFAYFILVAGTCLTVNSSLATAAAATGSQVERGKYLVTLAGCNDCHTSGALHGPPDVQKVLGGSDVGFAVPGQGVFVGRNLTPDRETGLGNWTTEQIVTAFTKGVRPDGRVLAPAMPWMSFSHLTTDDALAIAAYLKSLPAVSHAVPGPFGPGEKPSVLVLPVVSADDYMNLPKPPPHAD